MKRSLKILAIVFCSFAVALSLGVSFSPAAQPAYALVLKQGSTGSTVKTLQQKLKNWGYYTGAVDGIYGAKTVAAVKYFQRKNGLTADGIAGPKTLSAMGISSGSSSATSSTLCAPPSSSIPISTCSPNSSRAKRGAKVTSDRWRSARWL